MGSCGSVPNQGMAAIPAAANFSRVVIQHDAFTVHAAGWLGMRNFDSRFLVAAHTRIGNRNSPQHGRCELRRLGRGVDVSRLVTHFVRDSRAGLGETQERNCDQQQD